MPPRLPRFIALRALAVALLAVVALTVGGGVSRTPPATADVAADRDAAAALKTQVNAESAKIATTSAGLARAQQRLDVLDARADARQTQLKNTQDELIRTRARLARLETKAALATKLLSRNLVAAYETGKPDFVTVVMNAHGFSDLLELASFYKRVSDNNGRILDATRDAKREAAAQSVRLESMRQRFTALAAAAVHDRNEADVVRSAILHRQQAQLEARDGTSAKLGAIRARIRKVERAQAAAARAAAAVNTATTDAPVISGDGNSVVDKVIAGANQIASTPYVWGGGHGSFQSSGYDCSGSVSYALAAGGLLSSPLDSTGLESWGEAGPGRRITVYANAGHAYMYVDGRRYDTSAMSGGGTRWTTAPRSNAGFVARHPPGL